MRITGLPNFRHDLETHYADHYVNGLYTVIVADNEMHFMHDFGRTYTFKRKGNTFVYGTLSLNDGHWFISKQEIYPSDGQHLLDMLESIRSQDKVDYIVAAFTLACTIAVERICSMAFN